jgi:large subunit ribosomal protein L11
MTWRTLQLDAGNASVADGSPRPGHQTAGRLSAAQLRDIAERKLPELNTADIAAAMRTVAGTARSMGVVEEG